MAQIHEFINEQPLRYETYLDENGGNLSGGQKQRLAIARAMLKNPDILILDEATSNLDTVTEKAVQETLENYSDGMTTIIIAHRLSTIKKCDKIYVMEKGRVVEGGSHDELMTKEKGYYKRLYKENIASKEINMGKPSLEYNEAMAKIKMDSTENEEEAYRVKVLAEYKKTFTELKNKVKEYELLESSSKSKKELLKDLKENYDDTKLKLYFQTLSKIDDLEKNYNRELATIKSDLSLYDILYDMSENNVDKDGKDLVVSKLLAEKLSELLSDKEALNKQKEELKAQIKLIDEDISKTEIKAEKEGIINKTMDFTEGDLLQEGQLLATIIPKEEGEFKTEIYIKNSDIAGIGEGASIKYIIEALPKEKFGIINGNVIKIEGSIDADKIFDEKGNKGKITVGMQATAKILRENKTIFNYIMEKVNIF